MVYGGNFVPIEEEMPHRIELILKTWSLGRHMRPGVKKVMIPISTEVFLYEEMVRENIDDEALINTDAPLTPTPYIIYTSGSTGVPKGVAACRSVIDYIESLTDVLEVDENTVFGNQTFTLMF